MGAPCRHISEGDGAAPEGRLAVAGSPNPPQVPAWRPRGGSFESGGRRYRLQGAAWLVLENEAAMINGSVLVLSRAFEPIHITTARRALILLSKDAVRAVGTDFRLYDLDAWLALEPRDEEYVCTPSRRVSLPRVVVVHGLNRVSRREVKFSRRNVYLRDGGECCYCGRHGRQEDMTLDHVMPVSRGGRSTWSNVALACRACNALKDNRTPEEAGMKMLRRPTRPTWLTFMTLSGRAVAHPSWRPFAPHLFGEKVVK